MRDFYFFTSKKITAKECVCALSQEIKDAKLNGDDGIMIDGKFRSFLWFSNDTIDDFFLSEEEKENLIRKIGFQNPCITDFETHRSCDLKRVIKVIVGLCPDLHIYDDDDFLGTAQEYLDTEFDY